MRAEELRLVSDRRQALVARSLNVGAPLAPPRLRAWVEEETERARSHRRQPLIRVGAPALVASLLASIVVVALSLPGLLPGGPTAVDAHELAGRGATDEPPAAQPGRPSLLAKSFAGVTFPNWSTEDWVATGQRTDELDGRRTATVFYAHRKHKRGQHTIAYTVVSGDPLEPPADARRLRIRGVELSLFRHGGHEVAVFERGGHTCVLTAHVLNTSTLLKLSSWKGDGEVRF